MKANPVKQKIRAGDVSLGTMVFEFNTTGSSDIGHAHPRRQPQNLDDAFGLVRRHSAGNTDPDAKD